MTVTVTVTGQIKFALTIIVVLKGPKFKPVSADLGKYWAISSNIRVFLVDDRFVRCGPSMINAVPGQ